MTVVTVVYLWQSYSRRSAGNTARTVCMRSTQRPGRPERGLNPSSWRHLVLAPACCSTKAKYQLGPCNDKVITERSPDRTLLSNANERMACCSLSTRRLANLLYSANPRNSQACQYLGVNVCIGKGPHTNTFSEHFWLPRAPLRLLIAIKCLRFAFPEAFKPNNKSISNQLRFRYRLRDNFCSIFDLGSSPF